MIDLSDKKERMKYLCQRLAVEEDPHIFGQLIRELNDLIETKDGRIRTEQANKQPDHDGGGSLG